MKEFQHCAPNKEVIFNHLLRSARNQIECTFGWIKARSFTKNHLPSIIFACFVLHNFCEIEKIGIDPYAVDQLIWEERRQIKIDKLNSYTTPMGNRVRYAITSYFKEYL